MFLHLLLFSLLCASSFLSAHPRRALVVTGELSGDRLGAWYIQKYKKKYPQTDTEVFAIGGPHLAAQGAHIISPYTKLELGFAGLWNAFCHTFALSKEADNLITFIPQNKITDVILVDCPLINLSLARRIKRKFPSIEITYVAPPELWIWGKWGIDWWLNRYCDEIIVLYPFEQEWYTRQNLKTTWFGWPLYDQFKPYANIPEKTACVAFLPGSRQSELATTVPLYKKTMELLHAHYPELSFIWFAAHPSHCKMIEDLLSSSLMLPSQWQIIINTTDDARKMLSSCCSAVSKPGTITLELALLHVPTVIAFKVSWPTYWLSRWCLQVDHIGLPNLLLGQELFPELIQSECTPHAIADQIGAWYRLYRDQAPLYDYLLHKCNKIHDILKIKEST